MYICIYIYTHLFLAPRSSHQDNLLFNTPGYSQHKTPIAMARGGGPHPLAPCPIPNKKTPAQPAENKTPLLH